MYRFLIAALLFVAAPALADEARPNVSRWLHPQIAQVCFATGEQRSNMNKICFYNCGGSQAAITVGVVDLCPITINR